MMRARVGAQFATLVVFMGYLGYERGDWRLAPKYQDAKKEKQEHDASSDNDGAAAAK